MVKGDTKMREIIKLNSRTIQEQHKKRVAAYARVSMESERLMHSLSAQVSYYSEFIQNNPEWEYVGVYTDDYVIIGISLKKPIKPMFFSNLIFSIFLAELNSLYKAYIRQANEELNVQLLLHGNTIQ